MKEYKWELYNGLNSLYGKSFNVGPTIVGLLFDPLLWPIFHSILHIHCYILLKISVLIHVPFSSTFIWRPKRDLNLGAWLPTWIWKRLLSPLDHDSRISSVYFLDLPFFPLYFVLQVLACWSMCESAETRHVIFYCLL